MKSQIHHSNVLVTILFCLSVGMLTATPVQAGDTWETPLFEGFDGAIVIRTVLVEDEDDDPVAAGVQAAKQLKAAIGKAPLKAVIVSECFEDLDYKEELLRGVCSEIPAEMIYGSSTYGSFTQSGCTSFDSVCLMAIAGEAISVAAALVTDMEVSKLTFEDNEDLIKQRLTTAGAKLTQKLRHTDQDRLLVTFADAHSPKNQYLVEGAQRVLGKDFPSTGGSANKNAGQTFVYYQGKTYTDAAVGLMLAGHFRVALSGRKAMDNDQVIATAKDGAAQALKDFSAEPTAVLAFNCAGRRGKLRRPEDELVAIQEAVGKTVPLFGCYCAGEVGPLDASEKDSDALSGGSGWHVMFTILGR